MARIKKVLDKEYLLNESFKESPYKNLRISFSHFFTFLKLPRNSPTSGDKINLKKI